MYTKIQIFYIKNEQELRLILNKYMVQFNDSEYKLKKDVGFDKVCIILDFRGNDLNRDDLEKKAHKLQRYSNEILLCKIDFQYNVWIEIYQERDYFVFFNEFMENGEIKSEYKRSKFVFYVYLDSKDGKQSVDEQKLYFYFLIANRYGKDNFNLKACFSKRDISSAEDIRWINSNYHRICTYSLIQLMVSEINAKIRVGNEEEKLKLENAKYIGKILPPFLINESSYIELAKPVNSQRWEKIQKPRNMVYKKEMNLEDVLITLCSRYLFNNKEGGKAFGNIREKTFKSPQFFKLIEGIPVIALLIFAEFDFYSRLEMLREYKKLSNKSRIMVSDLLDDYQSKQKYEDYCVHMNMVKQGMNIRSMLTKDISQDTARAFEEIDKDLEKNDENRDKYEEELYQTYGLHVQIVTEVYEAVTISEGILQLIDNVVLHAYQGIMSMRIHSLDDKTVLRERYPSYFLMRENRMQTRYFLEVRVSDLSGSNIADKFKLKYQDFGSGLTESDKEIFDKFSLASFFNPSEAEEKIWKLFYKDSQNVVNHYGLQIFDSIIRSKDGYFSVTSGEEIYRSGKGIEGKDELILSCPGTSYTILLPLDDRSSEDKNIYDSMLAYDIKYYLEDINHKEICIFDFSDMKRPNDRDRIVFYDSVCSRIRERMKENLIDVVDVDRVVYLEGVVKGILLYLFQEKEKNKEKKIEIAFINCKSYQIVEIVRLISLSYDKAGTNDKMQKVQIYIRGKNIGEEIIFFGNTLTEVGNNIMKLACMRGVLYDNFQAVNTLLKRR